MIHVCSIRHDSRLPHTSWFTFCSIRHDSRFAPYVMVHVLPHTSWFTFCPYAMVHVLPIRHGSRFASYALKGQKLLAQGNALGNTDASLSPCKGKSLQISGNIQSCCPFGARGDQLGVVTTFRPYSNQYCMREASRVSRSWMDF